MDFIHLKPEQRQSFDEDGFLVVRKAFDAEAVARLLEAGDRLAESFLNKPEVINRPEYNHLDLRPGLLREKALLALVCSSVYRVVARSVAQSQYSSTLDSSHLQKTRKPGCPSFRRGWHRDIRIPRDLGHKGLAARRHQGLLLFDGFSTARLRHDFDGARKPLENRAAVYSERPC